MNTYDEASCRFAIRPFWTGQSAISYKRIDESLPTDLNLISLITVGLHSTFVRISASARSRQFGKAIRNIRKDLDQLAKSLADLSIDESRYTAVLVSVTDDISDSELEFFPNDDGVFQVHVGCQTDPISPGFSIDVMRKVSIAVLSCDVSSADKRQMKVVLEREILRMDSE